MQKDRFAPSPVGFTSAPPQPGYPQPGYPQPGYPPPEDPQQEHPQEHPQQHCPAHTTPPPPSMNAPTRVDSPRHGILGGANENRPQSNALHSAGLIFISGGMNIAWAIGVRGPIGYLVTKHNFIAWFIGAIIGSFITCGLTNKVAKKYILLFSSALVAIGGLVIACSHHNGPATVAACYLDGIANGLVFAPFLALAGELSVPYMRGRFVAKLEQLCFGIGILLQFVIPSTNNTSISKNQFSSENMKGAISAGIGFMALIMGSFWTIESPVLMLANNDEQGAINTLLRLQKPAVLSEETYELLAEHKRYLAHNKDMTLGQSISQALPTFIRLAYLRVLNAMSISSFVVITLTLSIVAINDGYTEHAWYVGFAVCRWLGNIIPSFCMDTLGRKKPTVFGLLVSCGLAFALSVQYSWQMSGVTVLLLVFQFFSGMAFTATSTYLSEAYPLGVKQHFIALTFVTEMFVFLIINVCDYNVMQGYNYFYIMGGMYLAGFLLGVITLPETKLMTLRGAQQQFSSFVNLRFN
ncbi:uncharacterized protein LOC108039278 isoform X2 [Drosophila rhopaloa]|uniref:Major facilitator superfamily (MFS) profile domain-containing protein n=1 Tax=Drosophila rhopaloa TaxID=1041015 RepID=A0ABM5GYH1_DRORH|nr:uncharacterized protein LOC108039278 isoform X2 [Drosophila rhopaloa]